MSHYNVVRKTVLWFPQKTSEMVIVVKDLGNAWKLSKSMAQGNEGHNSIKKSTGAVVEKTRLKSFFRASIDIIHRIHVWHVWYIYQHLPMGYN